jgi:hypothetical protein
VDEILTSAGATRLGRGLNPQLGVFGLPQVFPLLHCFNADFYKTTPQLVGNHKLCPQPMQVG